MKTKKGRKPSKNGHVQVSKLPSKPKNNVSYWINSPNGKPEYTHSLFRFPAKFHPPIVRWALDNYSTKSSKVLDPFTGSGTVQVESLVRGIPSIGIDVDPLACLITKAKVTPVNPKRLASAFERFKSTLERSAQLHNVAKSTAGGDITEAQYERESHNLHIPNLPNIKHWFRQYVIIDLAKLFRAIENGKLTTAEKNFFRACAAACIRRVSNADPAPVSGLEVTKIQAKLNLTRKIDVFGVFFSKTGQEIENMGRLWEAYKDLGKDIKAKVINGDMLEILKSPNKSSKAEQNFSLVITSPPYCRAVEYSRRHQLEMYWLNLIDNQQEHIDLTHSYIGRKLVRLSDWDEDIEFGIPALDKTIEKISRKDINKSRTVKHYFFSIRKTLESLQGVLTEDGTAILVLGNSVCCNVPIPTAEFISALASDSFKVVRKFSYALQNHHMQYGLWNGDGIKHEHVLVLKHK